MRNIAKTNYTVKETKEQKRPRIQYCGYSLNANDGTPVNVCKSDTGNLFFNGIANCGSFWRCPVCAVKISESKKDLISAIITEHQKKNLSTGFITLTIRHKRTDTLKKSLGKLLENYRKFQQLQFYKKNKNLIGQIKTLEITWSFENGWHPHLHILKFYDHERNEEIDAFQKEFVKRWASYKDNNATISAQNQKLLTSDISDYVAKYDITSEMTKSNIKSSKGLTPFTALAKLSVNDYESMEEKRLLYGLYCRYVEDTQGKHFVNISNSLKEMYKEAIQDLDKTDDEIVNETKIDEILFKISQNVWRKIAKNDLQPLVLNKYQENGIDSVYRLLTYFRDFQDLELEYDKHDYLILTNSKDYEDTKKQVRELQAL